MSVPMDIIRSRRRRARRVGTSWVGGTVISLLALVILLIGAAGMTVSIAYANLTGGLPPVQEIEYAFGPVGSESFQPVRIYDRSDEVLLFEVIHPVASDRQWLRLDSLAAYVLPHHVVQGTIAALDETFWTNPGYDADALFQDLIGTLMRRPIDTTERTIGQRLVETHILPLGDSDLSPLARNFRSALMSAELTRQYPPEQILEWYLNSAYYGNFAYGIDAAALVYFGKHATDLTLAEGAILVGVPLEPTLNPIDDPKRARDKQAQVLEAMVSEGMIRQAEADDALDQSIEVRPIGEEITSHASGFTLFALARLSEILQPAALHRSGLRVVTSLDNDLQLQAVCAARTHLQRMSGGEVGAVEPAADGSACIAAGLLPPLRPRDIGVDHNLSEVAVVILDPVSGQILSLVGPADVSRPAGSGLMSFIYLTAFARGYSPGTMVLDIPYYETDLDDESWVVPPNEDGQYHGPVRMRTGLANSYNAAAAWSLSIVGVENVLRTMQSMGVSTLNEVEINYGAMLASGGVEVTLLDMAFANGVIANQGWMNGVAVRIEEGSSGVRSLDPVAVLHVEDAAGRIVYVFAQEERAVLSSQLAFLMADVLSDEAARWPAFGQSNPLEIGRPAAAKTGTTADGDDNWTLGFTPSQVVGVWVGNLDGSAMQGVHALNGAAPIWHAIMRYTSRDQPQEGWVTPPGISTMEVCDPSGLLPTLYCPNVVREVFVHGTEPTHYDNLYRPFLINMETDKLATLSTPLDLIEEMVYLIPPPEAVEWARQAGIEQPPQEYDTLYEESVFDPQVNINSPIPFDILRGEVVVRGDARSEEFRYYRLQYGQGLNPVRWIQIGEDETTPVTQGLLGRWDTEGLSGLYTLQLVVVKTDGRIATAVIHVTTDNQPPRIQLLSPKPGDEFTWPNDREVVVEVEVSDEISLAKVIFYLDDRPIDTVTSPPYSTRWSVGQAGEHEVYVRAYDTAGNMAESERVEINILR